MNHKTQRFAHCRATLAAGLLLLPLAALAQTSGDQPMGDCSKGPIPDQPLELRIGKEKVPVPAFIKLRVQGTQEVGDEGKGRTYEQYGLIFRDKDSTFPDTEIEVDVLVAKGQLPDGKTFRRIAAPAKKLAAAIDAQPSVEEGLPEVQSWSVKDKKRDLDVNHVGYLASLRTEFDSRHGDVLPGRLRLCIPGGQTEKMFGGTLKDPITLVGHFEAKLLD